MFQNIQIPTTNTVISAAASAAATVVLLRSYIPNEFKHYLSATIRSFLASFSNQLTLIIDEYDGLRHNHLFSAAGTYLGSSTPRSSSRFKLSMPPKESNFKISVDRNQQVSDTFASVEFTWKFVNKTVGSRSEHSNTYEIQYFELSFHKKHRDLVFNSYLPHVLKQSEAVAESNKTLKIFTLKYDRVVRHGAKIDPWQSVTLDHPSTFDSLAMESEAKKAIMEDLDRFLKRREMYRSVGKAWKRGYLLFGPPGTGKSSLIAAMANYLKFDVYDLELTDLRSNFQLRKLLISTANRSILVVEDIDCSLELQDRRAKTRALNQGGLSRNQGGFNSYNDRNQEVTLSGLLNFIDGLWSSCGDERIIIFTTNHKDRLDPALLRPGRMDYHIHMSYCTPRGFNILASNYLGITEHPLFSEVQHLIQIRKVTPADIGGQLMKSEDPEVALGGLIEFLRTHKETKASDSKQDALIGITKFL